MNNYRKIVIADDSEADQRYTSDYRGRVQDKNVNIKLEPMFALTYYEKSSEVKRSVNFHKFIEDLNLSNVLPKRIRITNMEAPLTEEQVKFHFALIDAHTSAIVDDDKSARSVLPVPLTLSGTGFLQCGCRPDSGDIAGRRFLPGLFHACTDSLQTTGISEG